MKLAVFLVISLLSLFMPNTLFAQTNEQPVWWDIQSIDTMKFSRDLARTESKNVHFADVINAQVRDIAATGANYVAIGTPYDDEFIPYMKQWVSAARKNNLHVWFRGNLSGWEGWFGYQKIDREEHTKKIQDFIFKNPDLFLDGDIFSSCPECENGGSGDPRNGGNIADYRNFLIHEYQVTKDAFISIGKDVKSNYFSMNGDVVKLVMNKETTKALRGVVVVDHYVTTPEKLQKDIQEFSDNTGGKIILGEFGVPIPDIHGKMTEEEQAHWITKALALLSQNQNLVGVNYWVNSGGSTGLWNKDGKARIAVSELTKYYKPYVISGSVTNELNRPVTGAIVRLGKKSTITNNNGVFTIAYVSTNSNETITITANGYKNIQVPMEFGREFLKLRAEKLQRSKLEEIYIYLHNLLFGVFD